MPKKNLTMALALVGAIAAMGCSSSPTGRSDAGSPGTDSGPVGTDVGPPEVDTGPVEVDAGPGAVDAPPSGSGACTNTADMTVLGMIDVEMVVGDCAMMTFGRSPATRDCIMMSGLGMDCSQCFADTVSCTVMNCLLDCAGGETPACAACRAANCNAAFEACSGLPGA